MREVYQTAQQLEVDLICGILEENGIETNVRYSGAGDYMKIVGAVYNAECGIYVLDVDYDRARELIKDNFIKHQAQNKTNRNNGQRIFAWVMIAFWVLVFIGIFIFNISKY